jgi:hypothetical protein
MKKGAKKRRAKTKITNNRLFTHILIHRKTNKALRARTAGRRRAVHRTCLRLNGLSTLANKVIVGRAAQRLGKFQDGIRFTDEEIK